MNKIHNQLSSLCFAYLSSSTREKSDTLNQVYEIPQEISVIENHYLQNLITMTYECVIRDKINFLPLWVSIYKILETVERQPKTNHIWQIKFLYSFKHCNEYELEKLLNMENIFANKQRICRIMDKWENGLL
jgi:hypothetical protein